VLSAAALAVPWLGAVGGVLTFVAVIAQYRSRGSVVVSFGPEDWRQEEDSWILEIPYVRHGRRWPTATVFTPSPNGGFAEVGCEIEVDARHNVRVGFGLVIPAEERSGQVRIT
jgi:hypothetical protein